MKTVMKNLLAGLRGNYRNDVQRSGMPTQSAGFPLDLLTTKIGELFEVHYLDQGTPQVLEKHVVARPNDHFFHLTLDHSDRGIVYWSLITTVRNAFPAGSMARNP